MLCSTLSIVYSRYSGFDSKDAPKINKSIVFEVVLHKEEEKLSKKPATIFLNYVFVSLFTKIFIGKPFFLFSPGFKVEIALYSVLGGKGLIDFGVFFDKKYPKIVLGKSRWDLHVEIPNFGSIAAEGIRFDLVDQIPPFAPYLPLRIGFK